MNESFFHSFACMGTEVKFQVVEPVARLHDAARDAAIARAVDWFHQVESACNRFDETSELRQLCAQPGVAVAASEILFEAVQFAVAVADASDGAFDPTVGARMEARGFDRDYRTGVSTRSFLHHDESHHDHSASYDEIELDIRTQTITLHKPLLLDLGAVAKGLAIDMAARELAPLHNFMVNAGGDLYVGGHNTQDERWHVGIRHPRMTDTFVHTLRASNCAVCTSGDYERVGADGAHHLMDARNSAPAESLASVTVTAPSAMVADALATAAFALGPSKGLEFLASHEVEGLLIAPTLERWTTPGMILD
ncbi:MAG: FAD:protein FMN transferase [Gemmatimonadaceae bacterium]